VREREREREREDVRVCVRERERMCARERERERDGEGGSRLLSCIDRPAKLSFCPPRNRPSALHKLTSKLLTFPFLHLVVCYLPLPSVALQFVVSCLYVYRCSARRGASGGGSRPVHKGGGSRPVHKGGSRPVHKGGGGGGTMRNEGGRGAHKE
jgi:hypothetical protein